MPSGMTFQECKGGEMTIKKFEKLLDCVQWLTQQHIWRYVFASRFAENKIILDVACGVGYGADYLSNSGETVIGVDSSLESIVFARKNYPSPNLFFIQADCGSLPFRNQTFDLVVSFETIEHLPDRDGYLHEIRRTSKPNGTFLCSTPNKNHSLYHIDHIHEFQPSEFLNLLSRYFTKVTLCQQLCRKDDWRNVHRKNRHLRKRMRIFMALTRKKLKRVISGMPCGYRLIDCIKFCLGRRMPLALNKEKASITPSIVDSLDPCFRIQEDIEEKNISQLNNAMVGVCSIPRNEIVLSD